MGALGRQTPAGPLPRSLQAKAQSQSSRGQGPRALPQVLQAPGGASKGCPALSTCIKPSPTSLPHCCAPKAFSPHTTLASSYSASCLFRTNLTNKAAKKDNNSNCLSACYLKHRACLLSTPLASKLFIPGTRLVAPLHNYIVFFPRLKMLHPTLTAVVATLLAAASAVSGAGLYTKNSAVLQIDHKNYDNLIAKSNYTSVSLTVHCLCPCPRSCPGSHYTQSQRSLHAATDPACH